MIALTPISKFQESMLIYYRVEVDKVHFHQTSFSSKPFFSLKVGESNSLEQVVPEGLLQIQPRLGIEVKLLFSINSFN